MCKVKPKIFISYTIRDNNINLSLLTRLKNSLNLLNLFYSYIDLIDNTCINNSQENVIKNLKSSDILCIIETPKITQSPWVKKEIYYANKFNIPIINIDLNSVYTLINTNDKNQLLYNPFIIKSIQTILHNKLL